VKKTAVVFALIVFSMAIFLPFSLNNQAVKAQTSGYTIQNVDHTVQVLYSGHVVISDTIELSGQVPSSFEVGLPFKYGSYLLTVTAYDSNNNSLQVTMGVQLQDKSGFYGISVSLPASTPNIFTVIFTFSNGVLTSTTTGYTLDFPAYLSFLQPVTDYNALLKLPSETTLTSIDKPDGVITVASYSKQNLPAFTYSPATASFGASLQAIQKVNIPTLNRQVTISPSGTIDVVDTYKIVSNSTDSIYFYLINVPVFASNVVARDQFGRVLSTVVQQSSSLLLVQNVSLAVALQAGQSAVLSLEYSLPNLAPAQSGRYVLNLDLFPYFNYFIESASVTVIPPEGANIISPQLSQLGSSLDLSRNAFQQSLTISKQGVTYVDSVVASEDIVPVTFDYNSLWIAFRPTSWMWAVALVGIIVVALWTRPKGKAAVAPSEMILARVPAGVTMSPEHIKDFIEAYEEKSKITQELRSLEARAQHGRIPRRRYKVQRRALELRLETLSQNLANLKEILRRSGGTYADTVRQLEATDVELNEVALSLQTIEVRHESGELPMESYRRQLADLERRKEKAEASANGLLLRLRGEIR